MDKIGFVHYDQADYRERTKYRDSIFKFVMAS